MAKTMIAAGQKLKMEVFSKRSLTAENSLDQLRLLSDFENGLFRPTKCDTSEPVREKFDPNDLTEPVRWLSQPGAYFQFKQSKPFHIEGFIHNCKRAQLWTREKKRGPLVPIVPKFPEPRFVGHWVVWMDLRLLESVGPDTLKRFFKEACSVSQSEYGYLASEEDQKLKNFLVRKEEEVTTTRFIGNDPEFGIPGLYWVNMFGRDYVKWFDDAKQRIPASVEDLPKGGMLIQFGQTPLAWQSEAVVKQQQETMSVLGTDKFFDIKNPDAILATPSFSETIS